MYKLCRTEQSFARQRQLELGLLDAMKHRRFDEISVSDLCEHLAIPRKSFYRYFSSKDGALFALLDHTIMEFYDSTPMDGMRGNTPLMDLERFFLFWYTHKDLLDALQRSSLSGILVERATTLAREEQLMATYMSNWDHFLQGIAVSFAVCGLLSMVFQWHQEGFQIEPKDMAKAATTLLTRPLVPNI